MPLPSAKPTLHYLDIGSLGRGEVVRLFLHDAGVEFNDVRYPYDDTWPAASAELKQKGLSVTGKVPVLEYEGQILTQHLPILRYLARELGEYDGNTSLEKYLLDAVADVYTDWRAQWVSNLGNVTDKFKNEYVPNYYNVLATFYAQKEGPYLLDWNIAGKVPPYRILYALITYLWGIARRLCRSLSLGSEQRSKPGLESRRIWRAAVAEKYGCLLCITFVFAFLIGKSQDQRNDESVLR